MSGAARLAIRDGAEVFSRKRERRAWAKRHSHALVAQGPSPREGPGQSHLGIRPCTCRRSGRQACSLPASSDPVSLRHPKQTAYGCFLPDLTRFATPRRAGPDRQRRLTRAVPNEPALRQGFNPARADCGFRAPLAPRLARPNLIYEGAYGWVKAARFRTPYPPCCADRRIFSATSRGDPGCFRRPLGPCQCVPLRLCHRHYNPSGRATPPLRVARTQRFGNVLAAATLHAGDGLHGSMKTGRPFEPG